METICGNLYDFPRYYDLVFGSDWRAEFDFLPACFEKHSAREVRSIFEPACGTGRLLPRLAQAGYQVSGLDLNPRAVAYCNARLHRRGLPESAFVADMASFSLPRKVDAAFNMINSFRHLQSESQAKAHLWCVAEALRRGGLYVLGLHLTPTRGEPLNEESWSARRGNLCINTLLQTTDRDLRKRQETCSMRYDVYTPTRSLRIESELVFRTYTASQMTQLIESIPQLDLVETYDFAYDIDQPIVVKPTTEDVVYVLRKR